MSEYTQGPWYVGAQNDMLYITAGEPPAMDNDHPRHDANRTVLAKVYSEKDAPLFAAAPDLLQVCRKILADDEQVELLSDETLVALGTAVKRATR